MISLPQRETVMLLLHEAMAAGARQSQTCDLMGISPKTIQRWMKPKNLQDDGRKKRVFKPANKITEAERQQLISAVNSDEFAAMTPHQIVPILAERGEYIASERTIYRVLRQEGQLTHRQASRPRRRARHKPDALCATGPGQVLSWDITYLKTTVVGQFFYLYLFVDIFSRKIVGWQIHADESSRLAAHMVQDIARREGYNKHPVHIHSDHGGPMIGATILATFQALGMMPSYSRPSVSHSNPYSESLFKTLKYCPYDPASPFHDIEQARKWMNEFVSWYNHQHRHSGIKFVTPAQRHAGLDVAILHQRAQTYEHAKASHLARWSGQVRDWRRKDQVILNPNTQRHTEGALQMTS